MGPEGYHAKGCDYTLHLCDFYIIKETNKNKTLLLLHHYLFHITEVSIGVKVKKVKATGMHPHGTMHEVEIHTTAMT